jgi:hypothetical protein
MLMRLEKKQLLGKRDRAFPKKCAKNLAALPPVEQEMRSKSQRKINTGALALLSFDLEGTL